MLFEGTAVTEDPLKPVAGAVWRPARARMARRNVVTRLWAVETHGPS